MIDVFLGLGSNIDRYRHIVAALDALAAGFGELAISSVYESEAVGFDGDHFLNLVVGIRTGLSVAALSDCLKQIEEDNGRRRSGPKFSSRTLDIDILTYGDWVGEEAGVHLPRAELTRNAFVLRPMAELAPDRRHPERGETYAGLWAGYDKRRQRLWPVDFNWRGRVISRAAGSP